MNEYQPVGAVAHGNSVTRSFQPCAALRPYVVTYFTLQVPEGASTTVRTLPEGCADLLFDLVQPRAWLNGPRLSARVFTHLGPAHYVGVQLTPGAAHLLSTTPARDLVERAQPLNRIFTFDLQSLSTELKSTPPNEVLDAILSEPFKGRSIDTRVSSAMTRILTQQGAEPIAQTAARVATSERTLTRLFHQWIGIAPKAIARMVRFQYVLERLATGKAPRWAALAAELGYADQAHLIRDFVAFAGHSPTAWGR
jgi:AraC-like DNA-binding protein